MKDCISRQTLKTLLLILAWYVFSTGLSLYNKKLVGREHGLFGAGAFPAPLLMSSIQFIFQALLAKLVFFTGLVERSSRTLPWSEYARLVMPNGVITGLDIGFSMKSLVFINLSFYTMCKATVPVFLLFFAFVWGIERPSWELAIVVSTIVGGLALLVRGETHFHPLGFGLVMTASLLSGLRFTITQVLLHGHHTSAALGGPLEVLELLTPVMSVTVLVFSLAWEELWDVLPGSPYFSSFLHTGGTLLVILFGAVIAFLMVWAEYQVIKETSALFFMIAGTVKEVVTVIAAVLIMGDKFTPINALGLVIVIMGVLLYNWYKYRKLKQGEGATYSALSTEKDDDAGLGKPGAGGSSPHPHTSPHSPHAPGRSLSVSGERHGPRGAVEMAAVAAAGSGSTSGGAAPEAVVVVGAAAGAGGGDAVMGLSAPGMSGPNRAPRVAGGRGGSVVESEPLLPLQAGALSSSR